VPVHPLLKLLDNTVILAKKSKLVTAKQWTVKQRSVVMMIPLREFPVKSWGSALSVLKIHIDMFCPVGVLFKE
jgi:hypothetical protein